MVIHPVVTINVDCRILNVMSMVEEPKTVIVIVNIAIILDVTAHGAVVIGMITAVSTAMSIIIVIVTVIGTMVILVVCMGAN